MSELSFNIPFFPFLGRFSDPDHDFDGVEEKLAQLAVTPPHRLTSCDLYYIFNSFLPAGTFEEMAPYVPHALRLVQQDRDNCEVELLEALIVWCHVERSTLLREENRAFLAGLQEAFMLLFERWAGDISGQTTWCGDLAPAHAAMLSALLETGDWIHKIALDGEDTFPWLRSAHYVPRLLALNSVPHAAWTLWFSDRDCTLGKAIPISSDTRRRAVEMMEEWLMSPEATPVDMEIWDPVLIRHRELLYLFPDAL